MYISDFWLKALLRNSLTNSLNADCKDFPNDIPLPIPHFTAFDAIYTMYTYTEIEQTILPAVQRRISSS